MPRTGSDTGAALGDGDAGCPRPGQGSTMSEHMLLPTTSDLPVPRSAPGRSRTCTPGRPMRERGSSPHEGERLRPLTRGQVEDRLQELGDLYAEVSGGGPWAWNEVRAAFLRHLEVTHDAPGSRC